MNLLAGIHAKIIIKQDVHKHAHKQCYLKQFFIEWLLLYLHFSLKNITIDKRKSKKHLKNSSMSKILWQKII